MIKFTQMEQIIVPTANASILRQAKSISFHTIVEIEISILLISSVQFGIATLQYTWPHTNSRERNNKSHSFAFVYLNSLNIVFLLFFKVKYVVCKLFNSLCSQRNIFAFHILIDYFHYWGNNAIKWFGYFLPLIF